MARNNPHDLAAEIRLIAAKSLREQGTAEPTEEQVEGHGRRLIAFWHAENLSNSCSLRDIAELLLVGLQPIRSVFEECVELSNDDEDCDQTDAILDYLKTL